MHRQNNTQQGRRSAVYAKYAPILRAMANVNRLRILGALVDGPLNVTQIIDATGMEQTVASHGLRRLLQHHLVDMRRDKRFRVYAINKRTVRRIISILEQHHKAHDPASASRERRS